MLRCVFIIECGIARFLCAMRVYSTSGHHPLPLSYLCAKFRFFRASIAELPYGERNRLLTHPAYLMPREPKFIFFTVQMFPLYYASFTVEKCSALEVFCIRVCLSVSVSVRPENIGNTIFQKPKKGISSNFGHRCTLVHRCAD